ncbi:MAG: SH3 domain-containing protein, partial [Rhodobacteraceae bacterium]|nr:SH3 domain-containing protein [Paracoccaceae bacterium]
MALGGGAGKALREAVGRAIQRALRGAVRPQVLAVAVALGALGSGLGPVAAQGVRMVVEDPENLALNLRAGPGIDYPVIRLLTNGTRVAVLELAENWAYVRDPAAGTEGWGTEGWAWYHNLIWDGARAVPVQIFHPESDGLNIRNGPGTGFRLLTRLPNGTRAAAFEQRGNWVWLRRPEGTPLGWAHVAYLHETPAPAPAPAPAPGP